MSKAFLKKTKLLTLFFSFFGYNPLEKASRFYEKGKKGMSKIKNGSVIKPKIKEYLTELYKRSAEHFAVFFSCLLLSLNGIMGAASPLGIALFAAIPVSKLSFAGFLGTALGYYLAAEPSYYITAAVIAVLKAAFTKREMKVGKAFLSFSVFAFLTVAKAVAMTENAFDGGDILIAAVTALFSACFTFISCLALEKGEKSKSGETAREISVMLVVSAVAASLCFFEAAVFNAGYIATVLIILVAAKTGKITGATLYGVAAGLFLSLFSQSAVPIAALSVGGMTAGIFSEKNRAISASFIVVSLGIFSVATGENLVPMVSAVVAGGIFIFLPQRATELIGNRLFAQNGLTSAPYNAAIDVIAQKLGALGGAFDSVADIIDEKDPYKAACAVPQKVEEKFCKSCKKRFGCYGRLYDDTLLAINAAAFEKLNGVDESDKKSRFAKRCEKADKIFEFIDKSTVLAQKSDCEGYRRAAEAIRELSGGVCEIDGDKALEEYLVAKGEKNPSVAVEQICGAKRITVCGKTAYLPEKKRLENEISEIYGKKLKEVYRNESGHGYTVRLVEEPRLFAQFSGVTQGKNGSEICGDSIVRFETEDGRFFAALSDGMGSGAEAKSDSQMTVDLLKSILSRSFDGKTAMRAVNSALQSKNLDASFATVDILTLNLHNGRAEFIKSGAAPSFVKRGSTVYEITSSTLPAGLSSGGEYDKIAFTLKRGDTVVMMSDGVYDAFSDMRGVLSRAGGLSPAELCKRLISAHSNDDKSVMIIKIGAA